MTTFGKNAEKKICWHSNKNNLFVEIGGSLVTGG